MALEAALAPGGPAELRERRRRAPPRWPPTPTPARALCCLLEGAAAALAGDPAAATEALEDGARRAVIAAPGLAALCRGRARAGARCARATGTTGRGLAERARSRAEAVGVDAHPSLALVAAVAAFARAHRGRFAEARDGHRAATRACWRATTTSRPGTARRSRLALARAQLRLSDVAGRAGAARRRAARRAPAARRRRAERLDRRRVASPPTRSALAALDVAEPLTTAELRVLRFLPSHLSFREIGGCLHVSANTIKSQAHAVYRKLGASSRSVAVERARALGLLDDRRTAPVRRRQLTG